jgi:hypothetical protein
MQHLRNVTHDLILLFPSLFAAVLAATGEAACMSRIYLAPRLFLSRVPLLYLASTIIISDI